MKKQLQVLCLLLMEDRDLSSCVCPEGEEKKLASVRDVMLECAHAQGTGSDRFFE